MKQAISILLALTFFSTCKSPEKKTSTTIAFTGATIIDGTGADPITDGVLLIQKGLIVAVGAKADVKVPEDAEIRDVSGKFIMPGIINAHGHVGDVKGIEGGHYAAENVADNLGLYARYGVTTVVSLGGDKQEAEKLRAVYDTTSTQHARLFIAGTVINGKTPEEGNAIVDANDQMGVDFMKIRVDDNLGTAEKISEDVYRSAIRRSSQLGYKVATHMYYLDDAKKLIDAGSSMMAHSVRDKAIDEEFISQMLDRQVVYCPTFTRELSTFVYGDTPDFFADPFFKKEYGEAMIKPLLDPARQQQIKTSKSAITYKQQLPVAMANLKSLSDRGVMIVFGTDSGVPTRFMGYFEHLEMGMMADAGLTPMEIIKSFSRTAAEWIGWSNLGTLTEGHLADFIILDADPLVDIRNTRKINKVFIDGVEVNR